MITLSSHHILIVESIRQSREALRTIISSFGVGQIDSTHKAAEVKQLCEVHQYDVIFLGYNLGTNKKNGEQLLEELRLEQLISRHCIVIMVTAEISQAMVLAALEHKPDDYIVKPFTHQIVKKRLAKALSKKAYMREIYQAMDEHAHEKVLSLCQRKVTSGSPYIKECLGIMSRQHMQLNELSKAREIYENFIFIDNLYWSSMGLGKLALAEHDFVEAEKCFKHVIENNPLYLSAYDYLAKTYQQLNKHDAAEQTLAEAIAVSPRSLIRLKAYAELCLTNKNFDKATDAFYKTFELSDHSIHRTPDIAIKLAESLLEYSKSLTLDESKRLNTKAHRTLSTISNEFRQPEIKIILKLLSARLYEQVNESYMARDLISDALFLYTLKSDEISNEATLSISSNLKSLDKLSEANDILRELAFKETDNNELISEINRHAGHNILESSEFDAKVAYSQGLNLVKQQKLHKAIDRFIHASTLMPDHLGIKFSLLEAILSTVEDNNSRKSDLITYQLQLGQIENLPRKPQDVITKLKLLNEKQKTINELMVF